jgi:gluconolactonase
MADMLAPFSEIVSDLTAARLASGGATEGPVWHPEGYLTFVRFERHELLRWSPADGAVVIRRDTGEGNGCALDLEGRLLMCEGVRRRVTRHEPDGSITVLADRFQGLLLNKPNDIICRSDGLVFFTDPAARVPRDQRQLAFSGIFLLHPDGTLELGTDQCEYPNGLALSPDEATLYVAITRRDERCFEETKDHGFCPHQMIRAFDVAVDGSLSGGRVFADLSSHGPGRPDGIKVDTEGRVYCTAADGVWVYDPEGHRLGVIPLPEQARNLAFGGDDLATLFVTAGDSLYQLHTHAQGVDLAHIPSAAPRRQGTGT